MGIVESFSKLPPTVDAPRFTEIPLDSVNFESLNQTEKKLFERLIRFSPHNSTINLLINDFGAKGRKVEFIEHRKAYLNQADTNIYNRQLIEYKRDLQMVLPMLLISSTIGGIAFGLFKYSARRSLILPGFCGFLLGCLGSYGFWRYKSIELIESLNRTIVALLINQQLA